MNKFINAPDRLTGIAGCVGWVFLLAGLTALLFTALSRVAG